MLGALFVAVSSTVSTGIVHNSDASSAYDESLARQLVALCDVLTSGDTASTHGIDDWSCVACAAVPRPTSLTLLDSKGHTGLVGVVNRDEIVVVYRATTVQTDCWNDDMEYLAPYPPSPSLGRVHVGAWAAYLTLRNRTFAALDTLVATSAVGAARCACGRSLSTLPSHIH